MSACVPAASQIGGATETHRFFQLEYALVKGHAGVFQGALHRAHIPKLHKLGRVAARRAADPLDVAILLKQLLQYGLVNGRVVAALGHKQRVGIGALVVFLFAAQRRGCVPLVWGERDGARAQDGRARVRCAENDLQDASLEGGAVQGANGLFRVAQVEVRDKGNLLGLCGENGRE